MNRLFASAMISIMALCVCTGVLALGGVTPELALPAYALILLLGILWAGRLLFGEVVYWKTSPMNWPVAGFLIYALARYFFSPIEYEGRVELFQVGACALVYFVAANQFYHRFDRTVLFWTLMVLVIFEASYGLWQFATYSDVVFRWVRPPSYTGRASGTYICPNHFAGFLAMAFGLLLARVIIVRREASSLERSVILKVVITYAAVMAILGIIFSFSRAGWASALVGLLVLLFWIRAGQRTAAIRFAAASIALVLLVLAAWSIEPVRNYVERSFKAKGAERTGTLRDPSLGGRTLMWSGTFQIIRDYPVFGTGAGSWQWFYLKHRAPQVQSRPDFAHNDFLNLLSDYGIVGFALIAGVFVGFYRHAYQISLPNNPSEHRAFAVGAMTAVSAILLHSWFDFNFHIPINAVLVAALLGFTAAIPDGKEKFDRVELARGRRYSLAVALLAFCGFGGWIFGRTAMASLYTDLGTTYKTQQDYAEAEAYFGRARLLDPNYPRLYERMGDLYLIQARWRLGSEPRKQDERHALARRAVEAYTRSLSFNSYQTEVILGLARAYDLLPDPDKALEHFQMATQVDPNNAFAHFSLGLFYRHRGATNLAAASFTRANELYWDMPAAVNLLDISSPR